MFSWRLQWRQWMDEVRGQRYRLSNATAGEAHLKGHQRHRYSAIRPTSPYFHRRQVVAAARDGRYTLTRAAPPPPHHPPRDYRRALSRSDPARDATGSWTESVGRRRRASRLRAARPDRGGGHSLRPPSALLRSKDRGH